MQIGPTQDRERIDLLDILRGFALWGILTINLTTFADPGGPPGIGYDGPIGDRLALMGIITFIESKFFSLFSLLFGIGFALQLRRGDEGFRGRFFRRLFALGCFGCLHIALLWEGDILLNYAVVGLLLYCFRNCSDLRLIQWVIGLLLVPLILYTMIFVLGVVLRFLPATQASMVEFDGEILKVFTDLRTKILENPELDYGKTITDRINNYGGVAVLLLTRVPTVLSMFLLGFLIGRRKWFLEIESLQPRLKRFARLGWWIGLPVAMGVTAMVFFGPATLGMLTYFFNQAFAGPILAVTYAITLSLLIHRIGPERFWMIGAVGRMALTNYLLQSLIGAILFWPIGFGLIGRVSPLAQAGIAFLIYLSQIVLSVIWFRFFRIGPVEYLWRAITYLELPRLRK